MSWIDGLDYDALKIRSERLDRIKEIIDDITLSDRQKISIITGVIYGYDCPQFREANR